MSHLSGSRGYNKLNACPSSSFTAVVTHGKETELHVTGYCCHIPKAFLTYFVSVMTLGLLQLVFYWKPVWKIKFTCCKCSLKDATKILLQDQFSGCFVEDVQVKETKEPILKTLSSAFNLLDGNISTSNVHYSISNQALDNKTTPEELEKGLIQGHMSSTGESDVEDDRRALIRISTEQLDLFSLTFRYFEHKKVVFYWDLRTQSFVHLHGLEEETELPRFYEEFTGFTEEIQDIRRDIYGPNQILVDVKSYFKLFREEILNPFYIFQVFSIILWFLENYYYYAVCIVAILILSVGISLYETRKQAVSLRDMVAHKSIVTVVRKSGESEEITSNLLVPGDLILIPRTGCVMSCDAALISGNCIVNESMLTGESVPVTKTPLPHPASTEGVPATCYDPDKHKRHTLFGGTHVIQTRSYGPESVRAVVIRTGFLTLKGDLIRSIMFPKPVGFQFYKDSMKFIGVLGCLALVGIVYSVVVLTHLKGCVGDIVYKALDLITIAVPPSLPAAMTVGTVYAQSRLKKQRIFCISPQRINVSGKLKLICFDKTGTLTEDGLDLWGVVPLQDQHFLSAVQKPSEIMPGPIIVAMATCHSLTVIDKKLTGDPLDLKMFAATNWILEEPDMETNALDTITPTIVRPPSNDTLYPHRTDDSTIYEVGIVRQFPFSSALQRMSVVTRTLNTKNMDVYAKGSPEMITSLCLKETVPLDYLQVLQSYTQQGFRVLALAWKPLEEKVSWHHVHKMAREIIEHDFTFLGLLIMQNALKPATTPIIRELHAANIRTVMITGDNMLTAISVAKECKMILTSSDVIIVTATPPSEDAPAKLDWAYDVVPDVDSLHSLESSASYPETNNGRRVTQKIFHFAMDGRTFGVIRSHFPNLIPRIVQRGTIFARMAPDQKAELVESFQDLSYIVGMCGDGANDCGALKTAHAGISLSEAEASVASPFTSRITDISCVPILIKEGRAALVTSFGVFKFMAMYSIIQYVSVVILYWINSNLGDFQFLYVDLVITTTVAILMGYNRAYPRLVKQRPPGSLFSPPIILSIILQVILVVVFQIMAYLSLHYQTWFPYSPHEPGPCSKGFDADDNIYCPENTVVFIVSAFQYIVLAGAISKGPPYRLPIWTNYLFVLDLVLLAGITALLALVPARGSFLKDVLQIDLIVNQTPWYPLCLLCLVAVYGILAFVLETFIVGSSSMKACLRPLRCKRQPKNRYKRVEREILRDKCWPPVPRNTNCDVTNRNEFG